MADSNQRKIADPIDLHDDDPFAELTRIMGFDPRLTKRAEPVVEAATAGCDADTASGNRACGHTTPSPSSLRSKMPSTTISASTSKRN